ncbi:glutamine synthetase III [Ruminococcaceae bacterium OttesenSCG-928-A16]|nr:glutamine synthetase III [Ruminococcaceae bacterium OttesenSCG-928-A16]
MKNLTEIYGCMVFNDATMKQRLPKETYKALKKCVAQGESLPRSVADVIANAMKDWAVEKGATHFTHWFQPMTGITAEKHDSFLNPLDNGTAIMEFSGKELIKGEPDASSFPSGGLRATFEARGYTAWDPTSYAFIKENVLYIPSAFYSYSGEVLDKKTPLLRSEEVLNQQALRILRLFGNTAVHKVSTTVGPEQEYFLVDRAMWEKRKDLRYCGRTLFGAPPPKGQELETHYFGSIRPQVLAYMADLDEELWRLGIPAKTEHNEVAPAQHELAPIFTTTNLATEHNQLTMELMQKVAERHGLVCLLHEKPFAGVNGSGKHNNWSLSTDTGANLLDPGKTPHENAQFLLFLCAIIKAVDDYQDLLRLSVATAGNDHRLGANEAPPAIISIFLGDELTAILEAIEKGEVYVGHEAIEMEVGVGALPHFRKDTTDRNRTSPFAFTGNKFEFRMLGSSLSIAGPNIVLNTIVAEVLGQFADELEDTQASMKDLGSSLKTLLSRVVRDHKRILFNGNGYDDAWVKEAEKRGLLNLPSAAEALPYFVADKNIEVFTKHNVFSEAEMRSRCDIMLEGYSKLIAIEAGTMLEMIRKDIVPAAYTYLHRLADTGRSMKEMCPDLVCGQLGGMIEALCGMMDELQDKANALAEELATAKQESDDKKAALLFRKKVLPAMEVARGVADIIEQHIGEKYWPYPTYGSLLYGV